MASRRNTHLISRSPAIRLDPVVVEGLEKMMVSEHYDSVGAAINYLLRVALAADINDGAVAASRWKAYNEVRCWTMTRVAGFFKEMAQQLDYLDKESRRQ